MAIKPIEWESLTEVEQAMLSKAGESSPLHFTALWFNITQGDSFRTNWHHHYFNWAAERLLSGESKNIIVNIPPGGTKTEFWSVHLPVYAMVKFPRVRILNTSYSSQLVKENSNRSRSLVKSAEFQQFYPFEIEKDQVDDWTLAKHGKRVHQLVSRSSGGQITGIRGGYMRDGYSGHVQADDWDKIDDLFSEAKRRESHTRLVNTLRSRRAHSGTPFVAIQQRGHIDDSTAFLLAGGMGIEIDLHIKIPALIDQEYIDSLPPGIRELCIKDVCGSEKVGNYWSYWPAKENIHDLVALRNAHPYTFESQYMQNPKGLSGGIFKADDFIYYGEVADGADIPVPIDFEYRFITVDTAQKTAEHNDWTVFAEWGVKDGILYRRRWLRRKMEAKELRLTFESFVKDCWADNGPLFGNLRHIFVEDKSSGTGLIQELAGRLPLSITAVQRNKDKLTRAMDVQSFHAGKKVALPYGDHQNADIIAEVASFTHDDTHEHDDQTDVMIDALDHVFVSGSFGAKGGVMLPRRMR